MKTEQPIPKLDSLFQQLRKAGLDRIPHTHDLMEWAQIDPDDSSIIRLLQEALEEEGTILQLNPDPFRPTMPHNQQEVSGDLHLGYLPQNGFPYGISIQQLIYHLLVLGRTGGGKTTLIRHLLHQLVQNIPDIKLLILERKQEYTDLLNLSPEPFHVLDVKRLRFNVLKPPPGVPLHMWLSVFTQMLTNYMDIRIASSGFLLELALDLIADSEGSFPSLRDLHNHIKKQKYKPASTMARHQETVLIRLSALLNMLPGVFDSGNGLDIRDILANHTLFLLHDIPHLAMQNFMFSLIMAQAFFYRTMVEGHQPSLRNLMVLDEASALFRRSDEIKENDSYLSYMVSQARGYGIGLIAAGQSSTDLSHTLLANTGTKIVVGGLGRSEDADLFLRQRPITLEQRHHVMSHPDVGRAFSADGRYPYLLECGINPPPNNAALDDAALEQHIRKTVVDLRIAPLLPPPSPKPNAKPTEKKEIADDLLRILLDIQYTPFQLLRDRANKLKMKPVALHDQIKKLIQQGMMKDHPVHIKRGSPRDLYEVTAKGAGLTKVPITKMKGRGGYLHKFYQMKIAEFWKAKGWKVEIEGLCDSKNADLVITHRSDGTAVAIEIELNFEANPDHVIHNILKDLESDRVEKVITLVPKKPILKKLEKLIRDTEELSGKIGRIELACTYNHWEDK
ncbi:hypothetical protein PDESU_02459 [Pontiella desulfatans]|uniref:AAA+ ATPase domain-containing protein n=1 Tax=Pontiella desulfatans TaxID=2750659 RepID=A0A6C2U1R9_PONDE|nr:DUF87 domain-containing protein [Pontiella desulfatans]VGO13902.1 hypothetical protein PDESU_02459 [Pontiella desulfatans]